jgi:hypothetical protein
VEITSNRYFRAAAELFHGISAGLFPGAVWGAWIVRSGFVAVSADTLLMLERSTVNLFFILLVSLIVQGVTGGFRLHYYQLNIRPGFLETKRRMVLTKHIGFVLILAGSVAWLVTLLPK